MATMMTRTSIETALGEERDDSGLTKVFIRAEYSLDPHKNDPMYRARRDPMGASFLESRGLHILLGLSEESLSVMGRDNVTPTVDRGYELIIEKHGSIFVAGYGYRSDIIRELKAEGAPSLTIAYQVLNLATPGWHLH